MSMQVEIAAVLCGVLLFAGSFATGAQADTVTKSYTGPNGGSVQYRGDAVPGHYRGAVTVTTPSGKTYRRVTKVHNGPNGATASRRWVGPNGAAFARGGVRY
jgi:hypothetical protein